MPIFKLKGDITDAREGRDIIISTSRNDKGWNVVGSIMTDDPSILTTDKEKATEWFDNEETFKDVYAKKTLEYLEIVAKNLTPVWDSELSKYVAEEEKEEKETASLEEEINLLKNDNGLSEDLETDEVLTTTLDENSDDDLPF
jgi:argonaute-like protein implicated in RNA metabolism and viral defense